MNEYEVIKKIFYPLSFKKEFSLNLDDDAGLLPNKKQIVVSTDSIVEGDHFQKNEKNPELIAKKLLRVNLSDLASMGADPFGYTLNLSLSKKLNKKNLVKWIKLFAKGLKEDQSKYQIKLLGGDQGVVDVEASVNLPTGDGWAVRLFAFTREDDGFMTNPNSDNVDNQDPEVGAYDENGGRISITGPLSDNLSLYASYRFNEYEGPVNNWARELGTPPNMTYPKALDAGLNPSHDRKTTGAKLELVWEMDGYDLTSITSYTDTESTRITDVDLTQFWFMNTYRPEEMEVLTQEVRLTSTTDSNFQWIAGIYASNYENKMDSYLHFGPGIILPDADFKLPFELRDEENTHRAAFGNISYEVDDHLFGKLANKGGQNAPH